MKKEWVLVGFALVLSIAALQRTNLGSSSAAAGPQDNDFHQGTRAEPIQSARCQLCKDKCVDLYKSCLSNACTNSGGQDKGTGCEQVRDTKKYNDAVKICNASETACLNDCTKNLCP